MSGEPRGEASAKPAFRRKVAAGVGWTFVSAVSVRLMQFAVTIALARLLAPAQFGLFALAMMVITAVTLFRDLGLGQALIYHKTDVRRDAETTFVIASAFGLAAWAAVYAASPLVAALFGNNALIWPLRLMSFSVVISSLATVPSVLLEKELEFRKRAMPEFAMGLSYATVSILFAVAGMGVWSLVAGHIASTAASAAVAWRVSGWKPSVSFHRESARRILAYGRPLMAASLFFFVFFYIDNAAIGKWLGVTILGYYSLAFTICNIPATNITHVVNRVMYPAYSKLNEDVSAVKEAYMRTVKSVALLSFPIGIWVCLAAGDFVVGFFGDKWRPAVPLFRVLAFYGTIRSIGSTTSSIFMALGQPKWVYRLSSLQLTIAVPLVYPAAMRYGAYGVAILFASAYTAGASLGLWKAARMLGLSAREFGGMFKSTLVAAPIAVGASFAASELALPPGAGAAIGSAILALISYPLMMLALDRETYRIARPFLTLSGRRVYREKSPGKRASE